MAIGKEAILQRTFDIYNYNALSVNCEHDWKALPPYTNSSPKAPSCLQLMMILAFCLIFRPYFGETLSKKVHMNLQANFVRVVSSFAWII